MADQEYEDYRNLREALRTGTLEGKPLGPSDRKVVGSAVTRYEALNPGVREGVIPHGADETPLDPLEVARADTSDPAGLSAPLPAAHKNVGSLPLEGAKNPALFNDKTRADFEKQFGRSPSKVELERYQVEEWNKAAQDAETKGVDLMRIPADLATSYADPEKGWRGKVTEKGLQLLDAGASAAHGVFSGFVPGGGDLAARAIGDKDYVNEVRGSVERHPGAALAGNIAGSVHGVAGKVAGGVSGGLRALTGRIPVQSELANALGRTAASAVGGAAAGAFQAEGQNLVSKALGTGDRQDVGEAAMYGGALGGGTNLLGEGAKAAAGAIERGKFGPGLRAGEEIGGRPSLGGYKIAPGSELDELEKARVAGRLGSTADVATERLAPKYAQSGRRISEGVRNAASEESAAFREKMVDEVPAPLPEEQVVPYRNVDDVLGHPSKPDPKPPRLAPEHADAVDKFTWGYDSTIRRLKAGETPEQIAASLDPAKQDIAGLAPAEHVAVAQGAQKALDDALAQHASPQELIYRGMGTDPSAAQKFAGAHSFDFEGKPTSTSFNPNIAQSYAERTFPPGVDNPSQVLLKLKGGIALPTGKYANEMVRGEREAIENGGRYKVTARYRVGTEDSPDPYASPEAPDRGYHIVEAERVGPDYKDPTVLQSKTVSLEPAVKAAAEELSGPNVLPEGELKNILTTLVQNPHVDIQTWERLTRQIDELANLDKAKGIVDPRLSRISAAMREAGEGFPGLNEMRAGQERRFQRNELLMGHGGLPYRNKEVPEWENMTVAERNHLYGTLRNQTGDISGQAEPEASIPMTRRAMDAIAKDSGLQAELDRIPQLESIDQVRKATHAKGVGFHLSPHGANASAFGKALEFGALRGYPTLKALGSEPPTSALVSILSKSPKTLELLKQMRSQNALGQTDLANRLGLRGGALGARIESAREEVTQEDIQNLQLLLQKKQELERAPQ